MEITSRQEAAALGLSKYFTGKECRKGHVAERYVSSGACIGCIEEEREIYKAAVRGRAIQAHSDSAEARQKAALEAIQRRKEVSEILDGLWKAFIVEPNHQNWPETKSLILALTQQRHPILTEKEIITGKELSHGRRQVRMHRADFDAVTDFIEYRNALTRESLQAALWGLGEDSRSGAWVTFQREDDSYPYCLIKGRWYRHEDILALGHRHIDAAPPVRSFLTTSSILPDYVRGDIWMGIDDDEIARMRDAKRPIPKP